MAETLVFDWIHIFVFFIILKMKSGSPALDKWINKKNHNNKNESFFLNISIKKTSKIVLKFNTLFKEITVCPYILLLWF